MKTLAEKIAIMQACLDGKVIEVENIATTEGWNVSDIEPVFNWTHCDYRIKPEPLVIWVNFYDGCRDFIHLNEQAATEAGISNKATRTAVKFIEVIE